MGRRRRLLTGLEVLLLACCFDAAFPESSAPDWAIFTEKWCLCSELRQAHGHVVMVEEPSEEYQAFLDRFPITRYRRDVLHYQKFGPSAALRLPSLLARADWYLSPCLVSTQTECPAAIGPLEDHYRTADPGVVFTHASRWNQLTAAVEEYLAAAERSGRPRVLVVGGSDQRLSWHEEKIGYFRRFFDAILFEAKDVHMDGVGTMPMGLTEHYLRGGGAEAAAAAMQMACLDGSPSCKPWRVLAPDVSTLWQEYGVPSDRRLAAEWAETQAAREAGAVQRPIAPAEWWREISKFQFMLSPAGNGVQSSKTLEALLVLTVPIVTRNPAHRDLVRYGFPIVMVGSWSEITQESLDRWWAELSPRLAEFRRNCLTTEGFWRMLTSALPFCE